MTLFSAYPTTPTRALPSAYGNSSLRFGRRRAGVGAHDM